MNKITLFLNGLPQKKEIFAQSLKTSNLLIAVDGGANWLLENGFKPDFVVGDLDSLNEKAKKNLPNEKIVLLNDQNFTDFEKSLVFTLEKFSPEKIEVWAGTNGRIDHTLANFSVAKRYHRKAKIIFYDDFSETEIISKSTKIYGEKGQQLSILPFSQATGIVLRGLKFPLKNETLTLGLREGSSNEFLGNEAEINFEKGTLVVTKIKV
ncbi:thiamine diphosphokinase [bacterium]|nr:thiamine diphosphokinase [bacterium]